MKKSLSAVLCIIILLCLFVGCRKKSISDDTKGNISDDTKSTETLFSTEDISLKTVDGDSKYILVTSSEASETIIKAYSSVFSSFKKNMGINPKKSDDSVDGDGIYEILIGKTLREESKIAESYLTDNIGGRYDDFIICSIGNKIVILGSTEESTYNAAKYFAENYVNDSVISGGLVYENKTVGDFRDITIAEISLKNYKIIRPHYNSSYLMTVELEKLVNYIRTETGYPITVEDDAYVDEGDYEIIVGNTNRLNVQTFDDYNTYSIKVDGNKVYLNGGSYHATAIAISEFTKMLESASITSAQNIVADYYETVADYDKTKYYTPTWCDEFDGKEIDTKKWNISGINDGVYKGIGKNSVRSDNPTVTYVNDGKFTIAAAQDDDLYYGGRIMSNNKSTFRYGYYEISAIIPDGNGFWTAFWLYGDDSKDGAWYPEIDINECYGNASYVGGNYHSWPTKTGESLGLEHFSKLNGKYYIPGTEKDDEHLGLNFHTYGFVWTPEWIGGTVDGNLFQKFDISEDPTYVDTYSDTCFIMISLANHFDNCPLQGVATEYEWENTNKLIVENVYVYQLYDGIHELNGKIVK